jgi:hypothetical protein
MTARLFSQIRYLHRRQVLIKAAIPAANIIVPYIITKHKKKTPLLSRTSKIEYPASNIGN